MRNFFEKSRERREYSRIHTLYRTKSKRDYCPETLLQVRLGLRAYILMKYQ